jgi:ankyrin repeat protein
MEERVKQCTVLPLVTEANKNEVLMLACKHLKEDLVEKLVLEKHADVNYAEPRMNYTPLHAVVNAPYPRDVETLKRLMRFLLAQGADPNAKDRFRRPPIHFISDCGYDQHAILAKHGAELDMYVENMKSKIRESVIT